MGHSMITRERVKELLGITDTTHDTQIDLMIPIVENDVRRIMNYDYLDVYDVTVTTGETTFTSSVSIPIGKVIEGSDNYVKSVSYDSGYYTATVNEAFSSDADEVVLSVNIAQLPAIARMVYYRISKMNTTMNDEVITSKSMGPVSVSFGTSINKTWGYPQKIIDDLGTPYLRFA